MTEAEVLLKTHQFLRHEAIDRKSVVRLYTDAHSSLLPETRLQPFQRFFLDLGDMVFHPDLVGQLSDGECIFAVEAKGTTDMLKGLAQAEVYQAGFHYSFLAADASAWTGSMISLARGKNVGILSVADNVLMPFLPQARMPWRDPFQSVFRQMEAVIQVSGRQTFLFNLPTHYLVWAIILEEGVAYDLEDMKNSFQGYPMPEDWRGALAGAHKLGIVAIHGSSVKLTQVGRAVKPLLPFDISEWASVHRDLINRGGPMTLCTRHLQSASMLRVLLLQDSLVRLVVDGLETFPEKKACFADLARACDQLDHSRAPVFFLKPASAASLADDKGKIGWSKAIGEDYRSTTFFQYKSILKHSGLLKATALGGAAARGYDPTKDIWELS